MSPPRCRSRAPRATGGFTLIEIVMVVAMLAALAGMVAASMQGLQDQATLDLARQELNEVRRAVLQFKADTGFLPKRGIFDLDGRNLGRSKVPAYVDASDAASWFDRPENLWQLFERPLPSITSQPDFQPLSTWDPVRCRGWRGPYLSRSGEGRFRSGELLTSVPPVPAVADPFRSSSYREFYVKLLGEPGRLYGWFTCESVPLEWSSTEGSGHARGLDAHRPVRLVGLDGPDARVVSAGPDGLFDGDVGPSDDDVIYYLLR
ncbi:MAG: hypothetical protein KF878_09310 [Planctomycetes bacterium]|nr:hypothetical protein [Planctomycetota bacterium]